MYTPKHTETTRGPLEVNVQKRTEIVLLLQYMFSVGRFPSNTLPKTNMAPENSSQKEIFQASIFWCYVSSGKHQDWVLS